MKNTANNEATDLAQALESRFGHEIDDDQPINGAEAVDAICELAPMWRSILKKGPQPTQG
jgi:hypothetical protein